MSVKQSLQYSWQTALRQKAKYKCSGHRKWFKFQLTRPEGSKRKNAGYARQRFHFKRTVHLKIQMCSFSWSHDFYFNSKEHSGDWIGVLFHAVEMNELNWMNQSFQSGHCDWLCASLLKLYGNFLDWNLTERLLTIMSKHSDPRSELNSRTSSICFVNELFIWTYIF